MSTDDKLKKEEEKIFDTIPLHELEEEERKEKTPYLPPHKKRPLPWKKGAVFMLLIVLTVMAGIAMGWLVIEVFSQRERASLGEKSSIRDKLGLTPQLDRIWVSIYQKPIAKEKGELGKRIALKSGGRISVDYGKEGLFLSEIRLKRNLGALFSKKPRLYLNGKTPINFRDDIIPLTRPEEGVSIPVEVKTSKESRPLGVFYLDLNLTAEDWISRANAIKGNPLGQKICYKNALKEEPRRTDFLLAYGNFLLDAREYREAEAIFHKVISLEKDNLTALKALSSIYWNYEPKKSINIYKRLIEIDPSNSLIYYKRIANAQSRTGLDSTETLKKILSIDSRDEEAKKALESRFGDLLEKARKAEKGGRLSEAIDLVKKAREIKTDEVTTQYLSTLYNNLGFAHFEKKEYAKAIPYYKESIQIKPDPTTYLNMAMAYEKLGKGKEAIQAAEKASSLKPKDPKTNRDIYVLWARQLEKQKAYKRAIEIYRKSIEIYPKDPEALISMGLLLVQEKGYDDALEALKRALSLSPKENADLYRLIGDIYVKKAHMAKGNKEKIELLSNALNAFDKVLSIKKDDEETKKRWNEIAEERLSLKMKMMREGE
jgi:tetratricopeptide (TPR) repeat protein